MTHWKHQSRLYVTLPISSITGTLCLAANQGWTMQAWLICVIVGLYPIKKHNIQYFTWFIQCSYVEFSPIFLRNFFRHYSFLEFVRKLGWWPQTFSLAYQPQWWDHSYLRSSGELNKEKHFHSWWCEKWLKKLNNTDTGSIVWYCSTGARNTK